MDGNRIKQIETKRLYSDNGTIHAIFIALDIYDESGIDDFIAGVIDKFVMQKMISPPDTSMLLVTIAGKLNASEFCSKWNCITEKDIAVRTMISMLEKADVTYGSDEGKVIEEKSLLD